MIQHLSKPFQAVLWENEDRSGEALRLDFDSLDEARAAFQEQQSTGRFRTGVLLEWHKVSGQSELIEFFP